MTASDYETRLFVEEDLADGKTIVLTGPRQHYIRNVLRLQSGARIALFNGRDGEWLARIGEISKRSVSLSGITRLRNQPVEPDIWLAFAPLKRARIDYAAQKATELGATCIWPVFTRHTAVERINLDRLAANAVEAAEQCGRLVVPAIREPVSFDRLLELWPVERRLFCCDETGGGTPILQAVTDSGTSAAGFLIGPEGGFADTELDRLGKLANVCRVSLGARILRADTAAVAALACWQAAVGDWACIPRKGAR